MKKYKESIIVFLIYLSVIIMILLASSCSRPLYIGNKNIKCPTINKKFFYQAAGVRPTKQFLKFGNL